MKIIRTLSVLFLFSAGALAVFAGDPTGTWKWSATGPRGNTLDATLVLARDGDKLTGTIENRLGKVEIKDGRITDDQVSFTVERKVRRRTISTRYTGALEGDTIKGSIEARGRGDEPVSVPWEATRAP